MWYNDIKKNGKRIIMKRTTAFLLAALMILLCACSETGTDEKAPDDTAPVLTDEVEEITEETEEELTDGLPDTDLGGYEFRILSCYFGGDEGAHRIMYEDFTGNPVQDALRENTIYVEDRFNVSIGFIAAGNEFATESTMRTSITAGDDAYDIAISHDGLTFGLANEGLFYNMFNIEQFDFTKPWWPEGTVNGLSLVNQLYCASSYLSYLGIHWTRACMINKDYASQINIEIPYEMVREGLWTLDAMNNMVIGTSIDLDGNGRIMAQKDQVGFVTGSQTTYCLQESLGISPYQRDENGYPYLELNVERIDAAVNKWRELVASGDYFSTSGSGEDTFKNANALLCYGLIGDAYDYYRESEMSYGFLPSPKADEFQESYINCCTDLPWSIPKTISEEQAAIIGTIVEALSCVNYKKALPAYFEVAIKGRLADTPDDAEMLQIIADTRTLSFAYCYGLTFNNILGDLATSKSEVASYLEKSQKLATKSLEKLVSKYEGFLG